MKKIGSLIFCFLFPALCLAAESFDLEVYASRFDSIPIGVVDFVSTNDQSMDKNEPWEIIANDFDFSGRFRVVTSAAYDSVLFDTNSVGIYIDGDYTIEGDQIIINCYMRDVATQSLIIGKKYKGDLKFVRGMAHRYANEVVEMLFGDRGIFETRFTFLRVEGSNKNVALMDFDGHNQVKLTNGNVLNVFPAFADKSTILWSSYKRGKPDIYKGSVKDGSSKVFLYGRALQVSPDVSPIDGTIAYGCSKMGSLDIYTCAPDGTGVKRLTFHYGIETSPSWSPNGYQIAYTSDRSGSPQIYVMDADGANQQRVTFESKYCDSPAWSPKGDKIAYAAMRDGYKFDIWTVTPDGEEAFQVTDISGKCEYPTWSPDGSLIAFTRTIGGRSDLYVVKPDGSHLKRVTTTGDVAMPDWSGF
ncbi:MAG: hypothetical protein ACLFQB_04180 [Chitinispirillaceae bacterium]